MSNDKLNAKPPASIDMAGMGFSKPRGCDDAYYTRGSDFPVEDEDTSKGAESGARELVSQSDKQRSPRLNAHKPGEANTTWGSEGKSFATDNNSKSSDDESQTFAGDRDSSVSINLKTGQVESQNDYRLEPHPVDAGDGKIHARVNGKRKPADIRENRV
jgi:hypothetical protein